MIRLIDVLNGSRKANAKKVFVNPDDAREFCESIKSLAPVYGENIEDGFGKACGLTWHEDANLNRGEMRFE